MGGEERRGDGRRWEEMRGDGRGWRGGETHADVIEELG